MYRLTKSIFLATCLLLLFSCKKDKLLRETPPVSIDTPVLHKPHLLIPVSFPVNSTIGGFYAGVPYNYNENEKRYPLLIFLHGGGQYGNGKNDLPLLLNDGIPQLLDEKKFPAVFKVNSKEYTFIILSPQFSRHPAIEEIKEFIDYALMHYRVDSSRIYLSGLSVGGTVTCDVAAAYTGAIAAIVPISGVSSNNIQEKTSRLASAHLPVWIFHNNNDPIINLASPKGFYTSLNEQHAIPAPKLTVFESDKHDAWTKAIDPAYKENQMNIYEWMLQYEKK
jgi:predicted peptidase